MLLMCGCIEMSQYSFYIHAPVILCVAFNAICRTSQALLDLQKNLCTPLGLFWYMYMAFECKTQITSKFNMLQTGIT